MRYDTCSHFLCKRAPLFEKVVRLYHHRAKNFSLTPDSFEKPLIMVGPGTGVAPFRGFLQERLLRGAGENWLFFGERHRATDFYYEKEWGEAAARGQLHLETAFSRDGEKKVYVQHKMLEQAAPLWDWLERGAYLFVCGDAQKMAKEVDEALHMIIARAGVDSKIYIKNLKLSARYLRDIY